MQSRILVIVGNYGSGKTEIALNLALQSAAGGAPTTLVDLDIINPYFRSADQQSLLAASGVRLLKPTFAGSNLDIPALPAEILSIFADRGPRVILDVGGDDTGAAALGRFKPYFDAEPPEVLFVINACRPLTGTPEDILDLMDRIEARARVRITGLINNTNLGDDSDIDALTRGHAVAEAVAKKKALPLQVAAQPEILAQLPAAVACGQIPLRRYTKPEWMQDNSPEM